MSAERDECAHAINYIRLHRRRASAEAAIRFSELREAGDPAGADRWLRVGLRIMALQGAFGEPETAGRAMVTQSGPPAV